MDAKIKTREETQDGSKSHSGETQVRELGDVLAGNKTESNSKSEVLQELNKQYIKPEKLEALTQEDTLAQGKLCETLAACNYREYENTTGLKMYVHANPDQTVDVLTFANLENPNLGKQKTGFTYTKVQGINVLNKYAKSLDKLVKTTESSDTTTNLVLGGMAVGFIGGTIAGITTGSSDPGFLEVVTYAVGGVIPLMTAGYFLGRKMDNNSTKSKDDKTSKSLNKFQIDATYDIQALKSAMYE